MWRQYRKTGDQGLRDRLILTYAPLVKYVAGRLGSGLPAHVDEGDLVSYGLLGLIGAIERYEPDRDVKFETYAIARIKGAIIDELRAMDWVPRSVRSRAREIERAIAALEAKSGRAPTDEEIAKKVGITVEELEDSLTDIARSSIAALDELWTVSGQGDQIALHGRALLAGLIDDLDERANANGQQEGNDQGGDCAPQCGLGNQQAVIGRFRDRLRQSLDRIGLDARARRVCVHHAITPGMPAAP